MIINIILAGVGGQGILSIATVLGRAALNLNLNLRQAEVHGMSHRGGDVMSCLRLSDGPIASDLIPAGKVDLIIAMEPMEALRYAGQLAPQGVVITAAATVANVPNYPEAAALAARIEALPNRSVIVEADEIAKASGSPRAANMVLLGAAAPFIGIEAEALQKAIAEVFSAKGDAIIESNICAFKAGYETSSH